MLTNEADMHMVLYSKYPCFNTINYGNTHGVSISISRVVLFQLRCSLTAVCADKRPHNTQWMVE